LITKEDNSMIEEVEAKTALCVGSAYIIFCTFPKKRPHFIEF